MDPERFEEKEKETLIPALMIGGFCLFLIICALGSYRPVSRWKAVGADEELYEIGERGTDFGSSMAAITNHTKALY
jgi:hypothetical protein